VPGDPCGARRESEKHPILARDGVAVELHDAHRLDAEADADALRRLLASLLCRGLLAVEPARGGK